MRSVLRENASLRERAHRLGAGTGILTGTCALGYRGSWRSPQPKTGGEEPSGVTGALGGAWLGWSSDRTAGISGPFINTGVSFDELTPQKNVSTAVRVCAGGKAGAVHVEYADARELLTAVLAEGRGVECVAGALHAYALGRRFEDIASTLLQLVIG